MNGWNTRRNSSVGFATTSATFSGYCSATVFGASSPSTMWSAVMMVNAIAIAMVCDVATEIGVGQACAAAARAATRAPARRSSPRPRLAIVMPSCVAAMNWSGFSSARLHRTRHAAAFGEQLIDARLPHRDDRELGGHEKSVGQNQRQHREQADADVEDGVVHGRNLRTDSSW